jgi:hypothetical protein
VKGRGRQGRSRRSEKVRPVRRSWRPKAAAGFAIRSQGLPLWSTQLDDSLELLRRELSVIRPEVAFSRSDLWSGIFRAKLLRMTCSRFGLKMSSPPAGQSVVKHGRAKVE